MKPLLRISLAMGFCMVALSFSVDAKDLVKGALSACPTGAGIGDVPSCGKIWKLKSGKGSLTAKGSLNITLKGLVLNDVSVGEFNGTPDGVGNVVGAVVCGGTVAAETKWVKLAKTGNARIKAKLKLPSSCASPVIVVREVWEGKVGGWLAATSH